MANLHQQFLDYNEAIRLKNSDKKKLRKSRKELRKKIRKHWKVNGWGKIWFHGQGSYPLNTIITPSDGDFDLDEGVYDLLDAAPTETTATYHSRLVKAVEGHTKSNSDKNTCVRVYFAAGYHMDLPIYYKIGDECPMLAHKRDGWVESDPKEFADWVKGKLDADGQLKRIIRYLKGWKDKKSGNLPSGLVLTILACRKYVPNDRDDLALRMTLEKIDECLSDKFSCARPTTPSDEDLLQGTSSADQKYCLDMLKSLIKSLQEADENDSVKRACAKMPKHFGDRFVCPVKDPKKDVDSKSAPTVLIGDNRSA